MRIEQLKYIVEVAKYKSISKAAQSLFISQPSLSNAISSLEDELGVSIFNRSYSGVALTEVGQEMINKAERVIRNVEEIQNISHLGNEEDDAVEILCVPLFCNWLIMESLNKLKNTFPNLNVVIKERKNSLIIEDVLKGTAGLGLLGMGSRYMDSYDKKLLENKLIFLKLYESHMCAYVHKNNPLSQKTCIVEKDLANEVIATYDDMKYDQFLTGNSFARISNKDSRGIYLLNNIDSINNLIGKNQAVGIFPKTLGIDNVLVEFGLVKMIPLADNSYSLIVGMVFDKNHKWQMNEKRFIDILRRRVNKYIAQNTHIYNKQGFLEVCK